MPSLAHNNRTSVKATIKRASARARTLMNRFDRESLKNLDVMYRSAINDIKLSINRYADSNGSVRLESLQQLLNQTQARLNKLSIARNELLETGQSQAAQIAGQAFAGTMPDGFITRAAIGAVENARAFIDIDGLQLSDRLWRLDNHASQIIKESIQSSVIQGHSASQAVNELLLRGEKISPQLLKKMGVANADSISNSLNTLFTGTGNPRANALRLMRTELNRAHGEAYMATGQEHPDFGGWKYLLSPRHPEPDICDMHSKVNRYGLGAGVYPTRARTPWPAHPNTLSYVEIVFKDEISDEDKASKEDRITWLNRQPSDVKYGVLNSRAKRSALNKGLLKENEISTPWRILKKKYEKKGINIKTLTPGNTRGPDVSTIRNKPSVGFIEFKTAKTTAAANQWAKENNLADVVNYKGAHVEVANEWNKSIVKHLNEFPVLRNGFQFIGTTQESYKLLYNYKVNEYFNHLVKLNPSVSTSKLRELAKRRITKHRTKYNVWAQSTSNAPIAGVSINDKWAKNPTRLKESLLENVNTRFHPIGGDTIKSIIDHELGHELDKLLGLRTDPTVIKMYRYFLSNDMNGELLSVYAKKNINEFIAESWAEYQNNPTPRKIALELGRYLIDLYKETFR